MASQPPQVQPASPATAGIRVGWRRRVLLVLLIIIVLWLGIIGTRVWLQSSRDETRPADVIVIFGAAEYAGHPSPVLRARLEHALQLYQQHLAPMIITTGGSGQDPRFSEGGVARDFLVRRGVPEAQIIAETQSSNTERATERVAAIMHTNGMNTCLAVSDGYHMFRIKRMMTAKGVTAYASPRPESRHPGWLLVLREALSFTLWKLHIT